MLGNLAGRWIARPVPLIDRIAGLFAAGALGMMVGLMWHWSFPDQQGALDQLVCRVHRRHGVRRARDDHVAGGCARLAALDEAIRRSMA